MNKEILSAELLQYVSKERLLFDVPMSEHTSFKIGGKADAMVLMENEQELLGVCKSCESLGVPFYIMGFGSNLLVLDRGVRGVMIKIQQHYSDVSIQDTVMTAKAGASLAALSRFAAKHSLSGLEFACGIPGSLGGAVAMNAGAYGPEMKDIITRVLVLKDSKPQWLNNADAQFTYRNSVIKKEKMIVLQASMQLCPEEERMVRSRIDELMKMRSEKQPLDYPSAGSVFKRPKGGYAAQLIDQCGLKGLQVGGAMVSAKHCGFIINTGTASAKDILELIALVRKRVFEQHGILLENELEIIGEE